MAQDMSPLRDALHAFVGAVAERAADATLNELRDYAPKRSGYLAAHIVYQELVTGTGVEIEFISGAEYSSFVDEGTGPHDIAGPLYFFWDKIGAFAAVPATPLPGGPAFFTRDGTLVIGKGYVHHPGTVAQDFFTKLIPDVFPDALASAIASETLPA